MHEFRELAQSFLLVYSVYELIGVAGRFRQTGDHLGARRIKEHKSVCTFQKFHPTTFKLSVFIDECQESVCCHSQWKNLYHVTAWLFVCVLTLLAIEIQRYMQKTIKAVMRYCVLRTLKAWRS